MHAFICLCHLIIICCMQKMGLCVVFAWIFGDGGARSYACLLEVDTRQPLALLDPYMVVCPHQSTTWHTCRSHAPLNQWSRIALLPAAAAAGSRSAFARVLPGGVNINRITVCEILLACSINMDTEGVYHEICKSRTAKKLASENTQMIREDNIIHRGKP